MAKRESSFKNMLLTLTVISVVASSSLAIVYEVTKEPKAKAELQRKVNAIKEVVPAFDNNPVTEMYKVKAFDEADSLDIYPAKNKDKIVGYAVKTYTNKGFSGHFEIMVGFLPDGSIYETAVLKHTETPGLGDKMDKSKDKFPLQFKGKNPDNVKIEVKKDGGDIDAITAATISSRAFCDAVTRAHKSLKAGGLK